MEVLVERRTAPTKLALCGRFNTILTEQTNADDA